MLLGLYATLETIHTSNVLFGTMHTSNAMFGIILTSSVLLGYHYQCYVANTTGIYYSAKNYPLLQFLQIWYISSVILTLQTMIFKSGHVYGHDNNYYTHYVYNGTNLHAHSYYANLYLITKVPQSGCPGRLSGTLHTLI